MSTTQPDQEMIKLMIEQAVKAAGEAGFIITVTQKPLQPLAMGNYESVVEVRQARYLATRTTN